MLVVLSCSRVSAQKNGMMVRLSEIEIHSNFLEAYKQILQVESRASVKLEPGVIAIYPMYEKAAPTQIRILEIYASKEAYEAHLKTPHFKEYKTTTLHMVKSLRLVDMDALVAETMNAVFVKSRK